VGGYGQPDGQCSNKFENGTPPPEDGSAFKDMSGNVVATRSSTPLDPSAYYHAPIPKRNRPPGHTVNEPTDNPMTPNALRRRLAWTRASGLSFMISPLTMSGLAGPIAGQDMNGNPHAEWRSMWGDTSRRLRAQHR